MADFAFCFCNSGSGSQGLTHAKRTLCHWSISPDLFAVFILRQDPAELSRPAVNSLWITGRPCVCTRPASGSWASGIASLYHKAPHQACLHLCLPTSRAHLLNTLESCPPLASPSLCKFIMVMLVFILHQWYWEYLGMAYMPHGVIYLFTDFLLL